MGKTLYQGVGAVAWNAFEWLREIMNVGKSVIDPY